MKTVSGDRLRRTTFRYVCHPKTETGMYDEQPQRRRAIPHRLCVSARTSGSKAAYSTPKGGGKFSYWDYRQILGGTSTVGGHLRVRKASGPRRPNSTNGDVISKRSQPLASFEAIPGVAPDWCPPFTAAMCDHPAQTRLRLHRKHGHGRAGELAPVGHVGSKVECRRITDTIAPPPPLGNPQTGVASLARRCRYRNGISDVAVSSWRDDPNRPRYAANPGAESGWSYARLRQPLANVEVTSARLLAVGATAQGGGH